MKTGTNPHPLPPSKCPVCGYETDAATEPISKSRRPRPRDLSVCMKCGEIQVFAEDLTLRSATIKDLISLPPETQAQLTKMQYTVRHERVIG